jgi:hypothetical protein
MAEVSVGHVTRFRKCQWAGCHYFGSSFVPNTAAVLSKTIGASSPNRDCAARAGGCEVEVPVDEGDRRARSAILTLATEFVVGVTDQMDDALALFTLSLGDAIDATVVCPIHYHENVKHKTSDAIRLWPAATIDFVNATLRQEWAVYAAAKRLAADALAAADPAALAVVKADIDACRKAKCVSKAGPGTTRRLLPGFKEPECAKIIADGTARELKAVAGQRREDAPYVAALERIITLTPDGIAPANGPKFRSRHGSRWVLLSEGNGDDLETTFCANTPNASNGGSDPRDQVVGFRFNTPLPHQKKKKAQSGDPKRFNAK